MKKPLIKYLKPVVEELWWLVCPALMFLAMWYSIDDRLAAIFYLRQIGQVPLHIAFSFGVMIACITNAPGMFYARMKS